MASFFDTRASRVAMLMPALMLTTAMVWKSGSSASSQSHSDWDLAFHYQPGKTFTLPTISDNLSGVTYVPDNDHLFAVLNAPETLIEMTKSGDIIRQIPLQGFVDTEGIDYLGNMQFVVTEERRKRLVFFSIDDDTAVIRYRDSQPIPLDWDSNQNTGFEGVAWSARHGFFIAEEQPPTLRYQTLHDARPTVDAVMLNKTLPDVVSDYAGISLLPSDEEYLLVLSEESNNLHVLTLSGDTVSSLSLRGGFLHLWPLMQQPEGVTVDNDGNIYLVGEPNQMLVLTRHTPIPEKFALSR